MKYFIISLSFFAHIGLQAQSLLSGRWRGQIDYTNHKIPFTLEVDYLNGDIPQITFINGEERRVVTNVEQKGDSLIIPLDPFDVGIKVRMTALMMEGTYEKYYRDTKYPFVAIFDKPRIMKRSVKPSRRVEERWDITFDPETENRSKGVGLFRQQGDLVTGTIMTRVSDYRYFEGIVDGDSIKLSSFDGAHAFMFLGKKDEQGWSGEIIFDDNYSATWIAKPDANAKLKDPFKIVEIESGKYQPYYDLLGAGSGKNAINPSKYKGKVLIIQIFGTWCPNSQDQTQYLVDWYAKNKDKEVSILASSYEANYSQEYGLRRIEEYKHINNIPYDVVLGGRLSKISAAMPFPFMQQIEAFPTLVIVDKAGYVRFVHSYFTGPATGAYYSQFSQQFNKIINELVAE